MVTIGHVLPMPSTGCGINLNQGFDYMWVKCVEALSKAGDEVASSVEMAGFRKILQNTPRS